MHKSYFLGGNEEHVNCATKTREDVVWGYAAVLNECKSRKPDELPPKLHKAFVDVISFYCIIFESS